ncbi:HTH domain-containing protein [Streptomyces sp. NPDC005281]|uniref:HTH domain-containing protein n=1 Tax=Streptomyces sp. NPDC005281 TaxID=3155712 RepID=UPI0033BF0E8A
MTPGSARNVRRDRVRQLAQDEPELSHRAIGERLGVSKDTVRRDLGAVAQEEPDAVAQAAPQVSEGGARHGELGSADCATGEPGRPAPDAQAAPRPALPQRMAQGMAQQCGALDLSRCAGCCRDLAILAQTGKSVDALVHQAIVAMAFGYRTALARGEVEAGAPFIVRDMTLVTAVRPERVTDPAPGAE